MSSHQLRACWIVAVSSSLAVSGFFLDSNHSARADIFDPSCCQVVPWDALNGAVACPSSPSPLSASVAHIVLKWCSGAPIPGASVVILTGGVGPICPVVLTGTTNAQGEVDIALGAGGCASHQSSVVVIKANGVTIRSYQNCKSPDFDGASGNGAVGLPDLVAFAREFSGQSMPNCHDYTNDGLCGIADLTIFGPAFSGAAHCE